MLILSRSVHTEGPQLESQQGDSLGSGVLTTSGCGLWLCFFAQICVVLFKDVVFALVLLNTCEMAEFNKIIILLV